MRLWIVCVVLLSLNCVTIHPYGMGHTYHKYPQKLMSNYGNRPVRDVGFTELSTIDQPDAPGDGGGCAQKLLDTTNPRQKATSIAQKAAVEAKAATEAQASAGAAAARQAKMLLAEKAMHAARAAEAAMAGKQQIVEQLTAEVHEAESVVQDETSWLTNAQTNMAAAMRAAANAKSQLRTLTEAAHTAEASMVNSEQVESGAAQELAEKQALLEAAKNRVEELLRQLCSAKHDFGATRTAAYKAASSANEARTNAERNRRMVRRTHIGRGNQ